MVSPGPTYVWPPRPSALQPTYHSDKPYACYPAPLYRNLVSPSFPERFAAPVLGLQHKRLDAIYNKHHDPCASHLIHRDRIHTKVDYIDDAAPGSVIDVLRGSEFRAVEVR